MNNAKVNFEDLLSRDNEFMYRIRGTSMYPLLDQEKDLVIIRKKGPERLKMGDIVLFKRGEHDYILHRVMRVRKTTYLTEGDNRYNTDKPVREIDVIGVVKAIIKDGRDFDMESMEYKRFVRKRLRFFRIQNIQRRIVHIINKIKTKGR